MHSSWDESSTALGIYDSIIRAICAPAVFLFLMNSGATLIGYRRKYTTKTFLNKRINRVVFPLILWSIIYYIVDSFVKKPLPDVTFKIDNPSIGNFFVSFLSGNINGAFWFFYCVIALYLITPIISVLVKNHKNILFYIVILDFFFSFIVIYFNNNLFHLELSPYLIPMSGTCYIGFFVMGYLIKVGYFTKKGLNVIKILGIISFIAAILIPAFKFKISLPVIQNLIEYGGPLNFLYTIGLYVFIKQLVEDDTLFQNVKMQKCLAVLASLSLGIYILHPFFLKIFMKMTGTEFSSWLDILVMPIFVYITCGLTVYILKRIPFVNKILP
ncbi:acyltransferase [Fructilactobacillus lindneri]|uniref:acyltransferase n=1 Tax=Fructilactobacillus lindneri TaxID=53444 RepID=UPI0021E8EC21|nr:acyltransferase [Fructilactobacillus lindneri]